MSTTSNGLYGVLTVIIKTLGVFFVLKLASSMNGPEGFVDFSNYQNVILIIASIGACCNTAMIRFSAEKDEYTVRSIFIFTILISLFLTLFSYCIFHNMNISVFNDDNEKIYAIILSVGVFFFSLNTVFLAYFNGKSEIKILFILNSILILIQVIFITLFGKQLGLVGIILSIPFTQIFGFSFVFFLYVKNKAKKNYSIFNVCKEDIRIAVTAERYRSYIAMYLMSVTVIPVCQLTMRRIISERIDTFNAGIWQSMMKLSESYMAILAMLISVVLLPLVIKEKSFLKRKKNILLSIVIVFFSAFLSSIFLLLLRKEIFSLVFTPDFIPGKYTYMYFLLGDIIRSISWVMAVFFAVYGMAKKSIISDIMFFFVLILSTYLASKYSVNIERISVCYLFANVIYFFVVYYMTNSYWFKGNDES